jgi:phospholipid/cholesterol/gamma-HCH transport system ATP-binding protein
MEHTEQMAAVTIEIRELHKSYGATRVLRGIDLRIDAGETMVIAGGSGEGKSVLLRQIAGLETPDAGEILLGGVEARRYAGLPSDKKPFRLSMVFQSSALLNSLSVFENVGLRSREHGAEREEIDRVVATCLDQVGLRGEERKLPEELSGGMRKRVAIARALAAAPQVILYDEPTADLDPIRTKEIGDLICRIRSDTGATQVVVTHDLTLAMDIGTQVAVIHGGRIVDQQPARHFAASPHPHTQALIRAANLG